MYYRDDKQENKQNYIYRFFNVDIYHPEKVI